MVLNGDIRSPIFEFNQVGLDHTPLTRIKANTSPRIKINLSMARTKTKSKTYGKMSAIKMFKECIKIKFIMKYHFLFYQYVRITNRYSYFR